MKKLSFFLVFAVLFACQPKKQLTEEPTNTTNAASVLCVPSPPDLNTPPGKDGRLTTLFDGLDVYHYPVSTESELAQKYFDQGFILNYGFNHAEAARSFQEAIRQDPECAMCYWGLAYVLGPNYNAGMEEDVLTPANAALNQAQIWANKATLRERALIDALSARYPKQKGIDPNPYYQRYAEKMKEVMTKFPEDVDIAVMTAEALMDLHPWDLFLKDGEAQPWTGEILEILEKALQTDPDHPQAMHLYIHAQEAGGQPEKALAAADNLRDRVPGAGHLLHMPSHLYIHVGQYHKGVLANEKAVVVDSAYVEMCHAAGLYPLALYPHNWHFLAACAALEGSGDRALEASRYMADYVVDKELMYDPEMGTLQHYYSIPWYIMVKFAKWEEILSEPKPDESLAYPMAIWSYARGMAFAAQGRLSQAMDMLADLEKFERDETLKKLTIWEINKMEDLVFIAKHVLKGEIAQRKGNFEESIRLLNVAIAKEDQLNYNEPPDWFFSVRHLLGYVLMQAGKYEAATGVFETDLKEFKENGWALMGLYQSLKKLGKNVEAHNVKERFDRAWQWADVELKSSVIF